MSITEDSTMDNPRLQTGDDSPPMDNPRLQSGDDSPAMDHPRLQPDGTRLSHTDSAGRARMVDVGGKPEQLRIAKAVGMIVLQENTLRLIRENLMKKGDVLAVAEIAGIQAAKNTSAMIPLCHNINLTSVRVVCVPTATGVSVTSEVHCSGQTGVEMEALTAVSVALLTIYDMCKAVDKEMRIESVSLIEKTKHDLPR